MILALELAVLVVFGVFCIVVIKKAERNEVALKTKNSHLLKMYVRVRDERDKRAYEKNVLQAEIKEKDVRIDALSREVIKSDEMRKMYANVAESLKKEKDILSLELEKAGVTK